MREVERLLRRIRRAQEEWEVTAMPAEQRIAAKEAVQMAARHGFSITLPYIYKYGRKYGFARKVGGRFFVRPSAFLRWMGVEKRTDGKNDKT